MDEAKLYRGTRVACYVASVTQAICNNLAPLLFIIFATRYGLSYAQLGSLVVVNFVTQLTMDMLCARYAHHFGFRAPMIVALGASTLGLICLGLLPRMLPNTYVALCIAALIYGMGGGLLEVLVSPITDALPAPNGSKAAAMVFLHSFYCWGSLLVVLVSTLALLVIGQDMWFLLPLGWALVPLLDMIAFCRVPLKPMVPEQHRTRLKQLLSHPVFLACMLLMICSGAAELTVTQWASMFAERALGLSKTWGDLLGPCLFALTMGIGRIAYGLWGARIDLRRAMMALAILCVGCYLAMCLSPSPLFSLIACALCGFSVNLFWPGTLSLTSARFPMGGTAMFALLAACGDIGCSIGPWLAGAVADHAGSGVFGWLNSALYGGMSPLKTGLLIGTLFPLVLLFAVSMLRQKRV